MKSFFKPILSFLIIFLVTAVLIEALSPFVSSKITDLDFDKNRVAQRLRGTSANDISTSRGKVSFARFIENKSLHPYLGFVVDTDKTLAERSEYFGFSNDKGILDNHEDTLKVVISGGSVANELAKNYQDRIIERLSSEPNYKGKNIRIFNLAMGGYKQPQQLMTLNYFLSLGAKFDVWINLDGFNEVTLPVTENHRNNITLSYPRLWNLYARKSLDKSELDQMLQIASVRKSRAEAASLISGNILEKSSFFLIIWDFYDRKLAHEEYKLNIMLHDTIPSESIPYQVSGPIKINMDWRKAQHEAIQLWKRTSALMSKICSSEDILFFHFLQPNQYVPGSKTLTQEETNIAYENGPFDYKLLVETGYPILKEKGRKIQAEGEYPFIDLTMMFKDESRSVYADKCCHFNELGYRLIADRIADAIISSFQ